MDLKPKYKIGDKVVVARVVWQAKDVTCPDCLGTKEWTVNLPSGEVFQHDCQTCRAGWYSTGTVAEWGDFPHYEHLTIGSVRTDTAADEKEAISYMCVETGVRTGSVYYESNIFPNMTEAESWCAQELVRVKGVRQEQELAARSRKKKDPLINVKRKGKK